MTEPALFEVTPIPLDDLDLSADRRRTLRQHDDVRRGVHPLARVEPTILMHPDADRDAVPGDGRTILRCGSCNWRRTLGYPKCMNPRGRKASPTLTHGPATDCRAWWPACTEYEGIEA